MLKYIKVDRILAKLSRELKTVDINDSDIYEWIGEVLGFMEVHGMHEEAVAFITVKDYEAQVPKGFESVLQIARNNSWAKDESSICPEAIVEEVATQQEEGGCMATPVCVDCQGNPIDDVTYFRRRPYFDIHWEYELWTHTNYFKTNFTPIRLGSGSFFNSIVVKEKEYNKLYSNSTDEYSFTGDGDLLFSFKEGSIALSYNKVRLDTKSGLPLIPDNSSAISAITYYIKWKMAEALMWEGREGYSVLSRESRELYLRYIRQFKNWMKMPKGLDQHQRLLEGRFYNYNRPFSNYSNFFKR